MRNLCKIYHRDLYYTTRLLKRRSLAHEFNQSILRKEMQNRHFQNGNLCWVYSMSADILSYSCTQDINNYLPLLQVSKQNTQHTNQSLRSFQHSQTSYLYRDKRHLQLYFIRIKNDLQRPIRQIKEIFFPKGVALPTFPFRGSQDGFR